MVLFCLAMDKHRDQVLEKELPLILVRFFRPLAWCILIIIFYFSAQLYGWSIGPAVFFGALTIALLMLILLLTYKAKVVPALAAILPLSASFHFLLF
jgi:hypothetical protein